MPMLKLKVLTPTRRKLIIFVVSILIISASGNSKDDDDDDDDEDGDGEGNSQRSGKKKAANESTGDCLSEMHQPFKMPTGNVLETSDEEVDVIRINKFYAVHRDRFYIRNTGRSLEFQLQPDEDLIPTLDFDGIPKIDQASEPRIRGSDWEDEYVLARGYFHWQLKNLTVKNADGTTVFNTNSTAPPLEMELVHYAKKYDSLENAVKQPDGIIVTGHLFELVGRDNPALEPIARSALSVSFPSTKFKQVHGPLDIKLLFPNELSHCEFVGLYPLNPCAGKAKFILFRVPLFVSARQLKRFGGLRGEDGVKISEKSDFSKKPTPNKKKKEEDDDYGEDNPSQARSTAGSKCSSKKSTYLTIVNQASLSDAQSILSVIPKAWQQTYLTTVFSILALKVLLLSFKCHIYFIL